MRVLLVEDDPLVASDLTEIVEDLGHEVCGHAVSADEARDMADLFRPHVMLVDFNLEGVKTGLSAAAYIRERQPIDVVFITGQGDELLLAAIHDSRPLAVIEKPYSADHVRRALALVNAAEPADAGAEAPA